MGRYVAGLPFGSSCRHSLPVEPLNARFIKEASLPFAIAIEEDEETLEELSQSPYPKRIDGITSYRYIYRTGTSPKIKLRIRNHFNNIAPLAAAKDKVWPENSSASGFGTIYVVHTLLSEASFRFTQYGAANNLKSNVWHGMENLLLSVCV